MIKIADRHAIYTLGVASRRHTSRRGDVSAPRCHGVPALCSTCQSRRHTRDLQTNTNAEYWRAKQPFRVKRHDGRTCLTWRCEAHARTHLAVAPKTRRPRADHPRPRRRAPATSRSADRERDEVLGGRARCDLLDPAQDARRRGARPGVKLHPGPRQRSAQATMHDLYGHSIYHHLCLSTCAVTAGIPCSARSAMAPYAPTERDLAGAVLRRTREPRDGGVSPRISAARGRAENHAEGERSR